MKGACIKFCRKVVLISMVSMLASTGMGNVANGAVAVNIIPQEEIQKIYEEVKTPYDYGVILRPSGKEGDFDSDLVDNPHVFREGDWWYMTYIGHDKSGYKTGLARSKNLLDWEKLGVILENGGGDQGDENAFDRYNAAGYIAREHVWGQAPVPLKKDGKYILSYLASNLPGYEQGVTKMGIAYADKLQQLWVKEPKNPVLEPKVWGYEKDKIWKSQIIWDGKQYVVFYNAGSGPERMCMAYSNDLIQWTRESNNPILDITEDENEYLWGREFNCDPDVVKIGDTWVMFYFTDTPDDGIVDSFAVSNDMVHWQKSHIPLLNTNSTYNESCSHKANVIKYNGVVYHFYCAVGQEGRVIALSTSEQDIKAKTEADLKKLEDDKKAAEAGKQEEKPVEASTSTGATKEKSSISIWTAIAGALVGILVGMGAFALIRRKKA